MTRMAARLCAVALAMCFALGGCGDGSAPSGVAEQGADVDRQPAPIRFDDLDGIRARGTIRFGRLAWDGFDTLPRQGLSAESYRRIADAFATRHGLASEWVLVPGFDRLIPAVVDGRVDVAVGNITITPERAARIAFSVPLTSTREWVVGRQVDDPLFGIAAGTAYVGSLAQHLPDARRLELAAGTDAFAVMRGLETRAFDATLMDEIVARSLLPGSTEVKRLSVLPDIRELGWAMRPGNPLLKHALDEHLLRTHAFHEANEVRTWAQIQDRGRLRMLTINGPVTYYLWRGELIGFEYELLKRFADLHDLEIEAVVAPSIDVLIDWLKAGRGDVISASMTITDERRERGVDFSEPYFLVNEVFVSGAKTPVNTLADLAGRIVVANPATSFYRTLIDLQKQIAFEIRLDSGTTESILARVGEGTFDVAIADSHLAELAATFDERIHLGMKSDRRSELGWAVLAGNDALRDALSAYIKPRYRGRDYNILRNKYFKNRRRMTRQRDQRIVGRDLSPYDAVVRSYAEPLGFDWRLVVAQMYHESGFDPNRRSFAGARGLLQILPRTARELGVDPDQLSDPRVNVEAGVRYLDWTRARFPDLSVGEQLWFALASYNAGVGHVRDARRLARRQGLDPNRWFGNVERAMLQLSEPVHARAATHGYVRGREPVHYVDAIRDLYRAYVEHYEVLDKAES